MTCDKLPLALLSHVFSTCDKTCDNCCDTLTSVTLLKGCDELNDDKFRSRKWQITINNPKEHGYDHDQIKEILSDLQQTQYWCMCDEVGANGTYHTHLYIALMQAIRFTTLKKKFEGAHFEVANGTSQQNLDYVKKEGKWEKDKKKETNLAETFEEYGDLPIERPGTRNDLHDLYDMIKTGMSDYEIMESNPSYMKELERIEKVRQTIKAEKYKNTDRLVDVTYIYGTTSTGKTTFVLDKHGRENVYRVTDYDHPFDGYQGQDVILFDEFRSSLRIQDMLNYLDKFPLVLPCRYLNKVACYTKIYLVTNIPLSKQYPNIQFESIETYDAFMRRIHHVEEFTIKRKSLSADEDPSQPDFWNSD